MSGAPRRPSIGDRAYPQAQNASSFRIFDYSTGRMCASKKSDLQNVEMLPQWAPGDSHTATQVLHSLQPAPMNRLVDTSPAPAKIQNWSPGDSHSPAQVLASAEPIATPPFEIYKDPRLQGFQMIIESPVTSKQWSPGDSAMAGTKPLSPDFHIVLDEARGKTRKPGESINGYVEYRAGKELEIEEVVITFTGHCITTHVPIQLMHEQRHERKRGHRSTFRGKIRLFHHSLQVFQGPFKLRETTYQWPFQFDIPQNCGMARGNFCAPAKNYNVDPSQGLPPSMGFGGPTPKSDETNTCGDVVYKLKATLASHRNNALSWTKNIMFEAPLRVELTTQVQDPEPYFMHFEAPLETRSMYLDPEAKGRHYSLKERLTSKLNSDSLPKAAFIAKMRIPTCAIVGTSLHCFLSIQHLPENAATKISPAVLLKEITLTLLGQTTVRLGRQTKLTVLNHYDHFDRPEGIIDEDVVLASIMPDMPLSNEVDLTQYTQIQIPRTTVPSFKTFNINKKYLMHVKMVLECGRVKHKVQFVVPEMLLLPATSMPVDKSLLELVWTG